LLKNIDPLLSPELLSALRAMGHGDEIAIVDANYPAVSSGVPIVRLDSASTTQALDAVLSVLPLDEFEACAAFHMQVVGDPAGEQPIFQEFRDLLSKHEPQVAKLGSIERFAFYERVKNCFAVVVTGERRLYGNIILKKGIIRPGY
jgi:L-fucose mutarotase